MQTNQSYTGSRPRTTGNRQSAYRIKQHSPSMPKNFVRDKEYLYDENLNLKLAVNTMKDELQMVRIRNMQMEKEIIKYEKMFDDRPKPVDTSMCLDRSSIVFKLKQKQKEQQSELLERVRELDQFKRSLRNTRVQEQQIELESYKQECVRLRQSLNHTLRTLDLCKRPERDGSLLIEEQYLIQEATIKQLSKDNYDLSQQNKELETNSRQLKLIIERLESSVNEKERDLQRLGKQLNDTQREFNEKLRSKNPVKRTHVYEEQQKAAEAQKMHAREVAQLQRQINSIVEYFLEKDSQIEQLQKQLKTKQSMIEALEKQFYDLNHKDRQEATVAQQRQLLEVVVRNSTTVMPPSPLVQSDPFLNNKDTQSNDASKMSRKSMAANNSHLAIQRMDSLDKSVESIQLDQSPMKKQSTPQLQLRRRKLPKVNLHDVHHLGQKLRVELQLQQIPYDNLDLNFMAETTLSIASCKQILQGDPFNVPSEEDRTLIARYLIEDNQEDFIHYDENLTNDAEIVKCVIKKLIGRYELFQPIEEEQIRLAMHQLFVKYGSSIIDAVNQLIIKKKFLPPGVCDFMDLEGAFKFCDVIMSLRQWEFVKMIIFKLSGDLDRVYFLKLRDEFK